MSERVTAQTLVDALVILITSLAGFYLMFWSYSGLVDFGAGNMDPVWNRRGAVFLAISLISIGFGFVWSKKKAKRFLIMFIILVGGFMIFGIAVGILDASQTGETARIGSNTFVAFDVNAQTSGDIGFGLNARLISDAINTLVPSIILVVIVFQLLYAGEADEFIKAFLEGFVCVLYMLIYSLVAPGVF